VEELELVAQVQPAAEMGLSIQARQEVMQMLIQVVEVAPGQAPRVGGAMVQAVMEVLV
jgi:hypothetical protein